LNGSRNTCYNLITMQTNVLDRARAVLEQEAKAIRALSDRLDNRFLQAVDRLLHCKGRVITTGVGKAGAIARKAAATLASTGTPALYLHPAEGVHGDLGVVTADDVVLALSYSGESDEVVRLLPTIRRIGACVVAMVGNASSTLANGAQVVLEVPVEGEACPLGLAPTTSVIAMLALCDALAICVMEARGFTKEEFALYHPAGALGRRLTLRVADVMRTGDRMVVITGDTPLHDTLFSISKARAGCAFVVDAEGKLVGIVTDGDIRRALLRDEYALRHATRDAMTPDPLAIVGNPLAVEALAILEDSPRQPGEAPVVDAEGRPIGLIMLKDLLRAGIV
jgi:arabinose-5-phosphate isomerase